MNSWFTVKVKYTKQMENGTLKRVTEPYLLSAMSFTDAEARIFEELGTVIKGEFNVVGISRTELHDIFAYEDADTWYRVKISYQTEDADEEKTKKISQNFLVAAHSVKDAFDRITESLSSLLVDFQIPSISISPIVEIFPYHENLDRELERKTNPTEDSTTSKSVVFSAPGSDVDDEEQAVTEDESELEDEYTDEE